MATRPDPGIEILGYRHPPRPPGRARRLVLLPIFLGWAVLGCGTPEGEERGEEAAETAAPQAPGTQRMARRLARLADDAPLMASPLWMNRERLAHLQALETPSDPEARTRAQLRIADEQLRAGLSREAAVTYAAFLEQAGHDSSPRRRRTRSKLAAAHLRIGEQENCLEGHTVESCLLPIREAGVHRRQEGSRAARSQLEILLREDGSDLISRWLYNVAAMTLGDYPHGVPAQWLIPPEAFASEADVGRFPDIAASVGLATVDLSGGCVVEDLDGDGYLDVMVSSWGLRDPLRLFVSRPGADGTLRFEEQTREAGLSGLWGGLNLIHADYDNDGDADVLVLRGAWLGPAGRHPNSLLRNDGRGFFEDVTDEVGLLTLHPTQTATWGDYDNDGWLDLFIGNESSPGQQSPCQLYRNNGADGDGVTFTEVGAEAGVDAGGFVKGVVWGDFDNDGWLDLYISRMRDSNLLFRNRGRGPNGGPTFEEVGEEAGVTAPLDGFPTWFFDFDNDGWLDIFAGGYSANFLAATVTDVIADYLGQAAAGSIPRLYRNDRDGTFDDVTTAAGLAHPLLAMGANFGDLDNDGDPDFYLGTGAPDLRALVPNRMFLNDGGRVFRDVTTSGGFGHLQKGHGIAFADLDNDGDQDIFAVMGGAFSGDVYQNVLFANPGHGRRWITLRLEGVTANRSAIGARIRLDLETPGGARTVHATVSTGGSFGSSSLQQEIGLGDAVAVRIVEVAWPGGGRQIFRDLPMDRIVALRQGDPEPRVVGLKRLVSPAAARSQR